jgi:hypothetical protein
MAASAEVKPRDALMRRNGKFRAIIAPLVGPIMDGGAVHEAKLLALQTFSSIANSVHIAILVSIRMTTTLHGRCVNWIDHRDSEFQS